jgi:hypothetical protein
VVAGGLERFKDSTGNNAKSQNRAANALQKSPISRCIDPQLAAVIDAWPTLSADVRQRILAMVRAAGGKP